MVGAWNDPHMLAACMSSLWYLRESNKTPGTLFRGRHKPWMRYAVDSDIGVVRGVAATNGTGFNPATGIVALSCPLAREVTRVHRLSAGASTSSAYLRMGITVKREMLSQLSADYGGSSSRTLLWLVRTWVYADTVAPWRGVTEDAIRQPQKAKPLPSPVPMDVRLAIEACLEANETVAARQYYDGWRRAQLEAREEKR